MNQENHSPVPSADQKTDQEITIPTASEQKPEDQQIPIQTEKASETIPERSATATIEEMGQIAQAEEGQKPIWEQRGKEPPVSFTTIHQPPQKHLPGPEIIDEISSSLVNQYKSDPTGAVHRAITTLNSLPKKPHKPILKI